MHTALVIGIDLYAEPKATSLACAANDAREVSARLKSAGYEVITLLDNDATRENIFTALEASINPRLSADDVVVVYWAGHGFSHRYASPSHVDGWSHFLMPSDGSIDHPIKTALGVSTLWALLKRLETRRLVVFLDACFSGAFAEGRTFPTDKSLRGGPAPLTADFLDSIGGDGRAVICACGPQESAGEDPAGCGHGYFTKALIDAMDGGVSDPRHAGAIRLNLLTEYLRSTVEKETRSRQHPYIHHTTEGQDLVIPWPRHDTSRTAIPSWAFAGTAGGVGKTTLAMLTAELLAEAGHTVLYLDVDISQKGGTLEWTERSTAIVGTAVTFAGILAAHGEHANPAQAAGRAERARMVNVTPGYLRRADAGKILLLPSARPDDPVFGFDLVAGIRDSRSNRECRTILDEAIAIGIAQGATCAVIDCGAQFDPVAINALHAAHHPFIIAAAIAGSRQSRDNILVNCEQRVPEFDRARVQTVINRVPSMKALNNHWGSRGFQWLPFDIQLFREWLEGHPNFELGYDELSTRWHEILVLSDAGACGGEHRDLLPEEWNRFSKWALWITDNPQWPVQEVKTARRRYWKYMAALLVSLIVAGSGIGLLIRGAFASAPGWAKGWEQHPGTNQALVVAVIAATLLASLLFLTMRSYHRRIAMLHEIAKHSSDERWLRAWFSRPSPESPWWMVWKASHRAAIQWLHKRITAAR